METSNPLIDNTTQVPPTNTTPAIKPPQPKPYEVNGDFDFDTLPRKEKRVKYQKKHYILKEASEDARMKYEGHNYKSMQQDGDGLRVVPTEYLPQGESLLVSMCLFDEDGTKLIPLSVIRTWPHHVIDTMFEWVMENSIGLRRKQTKEDVERQIGELHLKLSQMTEQPTDEEKAKN